MDESPGKREEAEAFRDVVDDPDEVVEVFGVVVAKFGLFRNVEPHDGPERRVGLHGPGISADPLAFDESRFGDSRQNPIENRLMDLVG